MADAEIAETKDTPQSQSDKMRELHDLPRMTEEEIAKIDEALEKARGRPPLAAVMLRMNQRDLLTKIHNNDALRKRWSRKLAGQIPNEARTLHRKPKNLADTDEFGKLPAILPVDSREILEAFKAEQNMFKEGLMGAGLEQKHVELAIQMQRVTRTNFKGCLEAVHGTVTTNVFNLMIEKQECMKRLECLREKLSRFDGDYALGTPNRLLLVEEERQLSRQMREIDALLIKSKEVVDEGVLTLALAKKTRKREKPGFKPAANVVNI